MAKIIHVQIRGVEKAVQITADKIEKQNDMNTTQAKLILSLDDKLVGEFKDAIVDGWLME